MRNLKRALSLTLASVMLLGMMVVGTGASYKDADSIEHKDAVEVLNAISVMSGDDQGNFNPDQVVTRAEMAVIVCKMLYGDKLDVSQFTGTKVFTDVPAWAEGFVNLAASLDIVAGVGDGKFAPNEPVTTAQATLMLCKALGYFQNPADFGQDWALAAIKKGTQLGMFQDLNSLATNAGLKRDDVAALTFAAITDAVPVMYNELLGVYYNDSNNVLGGVNFYYDETLAYKNFDLVYKDITDDLGQVNTRWGIGTVHGSYLDAKGNLVSSNVTIATKDKIVDVEKAPVVTYTSDMDSASGKSDIKNDLRGYEWYAYTTPGDAPTTVYATVTTNGISVNNVALNKTNYNTVIAPLTGDGYTVKVYADKSGVIDQIAVIKEELAKVVSVNTVKNEITLQTSQGNIVINEDHDAYANLAGNVEVNDHVLAVCNATDKVVDAYVGKTVAGVVSSYTNKGALTVDGTQYKPSECANNDSALKSPKIYDNTTDSCTLFLDSNGYVIAVDSSAKIGGENICFVAFAQAGDNWNSYREAYVYLPDGTKGVYKVVSLNNSTKAAVINTVNTGLYVYTLTDNGIALKSEAGLNDSDYDLAILKDSETVTLEKDKAQYTFQNTESKSVTVYMNADTKFYMQDTSVAKEITSSNANATGLITTSTGLASIKDGTAITADSVTAKTGLTVAYRVVNGKNIATAVYGAINKPVSAASSDLVFITSDKWSSANGEKYDVSAIFTGKTEAETITIKGQPSIGLYSYKLVDGTYELDPAANCDYSGLMEKVTDKLLFVGGEQLNNLDKAVVIDNTGSEPTVTSASYLDMVGVKFYGYVVVDNTTDKNVLAVYVNNAIVGDLAGGITAIQSGTGTKADPFVVKAAAAKLATLAANYDGFYKTTDDTAYTVGSAAAGETFYMKDAEGSLSTVYYEVIAD